ncbi:MAG: hypothetical protein K0Q66_500 [Chitinophagaceae bacterium]|nr:hypothetical protein [Chitinophagaceae bacterium]
MPTQIKCPSCSFEFPLEDALNDELKSEIEKQKQELRQQMLDYKKNAELKIRQMEEDNKKEAQKQEEAFQQKMQEELKKKNAEIEASIRKSLAADFENQVKTLQQTNADNEEKLKLARLKEFEYLEKERQLKAKEEELELSVKRRINEEREKMSKEIRELEKQKLEQVESEFRMKLAEKEKQLEDQKKLAEEAVRKAQQGSMQLQGEVQELMLEEILRSTFPYDKITPVGKGVRGADCIHTVCNPFGQECGRIIYESKRTKDFSAEWIDKLKADMRTLGADIAVIVTQALPKDMDRFGEKDGVYICTFAEVRSLCAILRNSIISIFKITSTQQKAGDKMSLLYDYLTGNEFGEQWKAIREGFMGMKLSIQKERDAMEKLWKSREKQLEMVLLNATRIHGSIDGIAGKDVNINLLDGAEELYIES